MNDCDHINESQIVRSHIKCLFDSRFRDTLSVRLEDRVEDMSEDDGSEVMDGSVVSSVTDKYGFMGAGE